MLADRENSDNIIKYTTEIVSAFVANNSISTKDLPQLISEISDTLNTIKNPLHDFAENKQEVAHSRIKPAVSVKNSVSEDSITCLCCGKKFKSLKKHILASYGFTAEEYRKYWNLPSDYPMVAPSYSVVRQKLAKKNRLGK